MIVSTFEKKNAFIEVVFIHHKLYILFHVIHNFGSILNRLKILLMNMCWYVRSSIRRSVPEREKYFS